MVHNSVGTRIRATAHHSVVREPAFEIGTSGRRTWRCHPSKGYEQIQTYVVRCVFFLSRQDGRRNQGLSCICTLVFHHTRHSAPFINVLRVAYCWVGGCSQVAPTEGGSACWLCAQSWEHRLRPPSKRQTKTRLGTNGTSKGADFLGKQLSPP